MEKLLKQLETLKLSFASAKKKDAAASKEKCQICGNICELVHNSDVKLHKSYAAAFSQVFETLFALCDDPIADVRIAADESLNTIIRKCCLEGSLTRVHVELYKEIKRNGPARSIRSAFTKFALLVCQIKPQKCRIFATNLTPCLLTLIQRPEESISECLEKEGTKIFQHLGPFFNDEELQSLMENILPNLQLSSAQARRCASSILIGICKFCRKRLALATYLLKRLTNSLIPIQAGRSCNQIIGVFNVLRILIPVLEEYISDRGSKFGNGFEIDDDQWRKLLEITIYYSCYSHNSVSIAALECLSALLQNSPRSFLKLIRKDSGLGRSQIFSISDLSPESNPLQTRSTLPKISNESGTLEQLDSLSLISETSEVVVDCDNILSDAVPVSDPLVVTQSIPIDFISTNIEVQNQNDEDDDDDVPLIDLSHEEHSVDIPDARAVENNSLNSTPLKISTPISPGEQPLFSSYPEDIGTMYDDLPIMFLCRCLCRKFLIRPSNIVSDDDACFIPDIEVRVSKKILVISCVSALLLMKPDLLYANLTTTDLSNTKISEILKYRRHADPLIRSEVTGLIANYILAAVVDANAKVSGEESSLLHNDHLLNSIEYALADENFAVVKSALSALKLCHNSILLREDLFELSAVKNLCLHGVLSSTSHKYWPVKLALLELWSSVDYTKLLYIEWLTNVNRSPQDAINYQDIVLTTVLENMLSDENARVRSEAAFTVSCLVKSTYLSKEFDEPFFMSYLMERFQNRRKIPLSSNFEWLQQDFSRVHHLSQFYDTRKCSKERRLLNVQENNLSIIIGLLFECLLMPKNNWHISGCLFTLCQLAVSYPPIMYFNAWSTILTHRSELGVGVFTWLIKLLSHGNFGSDLIQIHSQVFTLIPHLLAGYFFNGHFTTDLLQIHRWPSMFENGNQMEEFLSDDLLIYCMKIFNIYVHVISDTPLPNVTTLLSKTAPAMAQQTLTPVAQKLKSVTKIETGKTSDKTEPSIPLPPIPTLKTRLGDFSSSNHFLRIYDSIKGAYGNYKICLDEEVKDKFISLLVSCFQCFGAILEISTLKTVEKFIEELLSYLKILMAISPYHAISTITQVLKALFGTNLNLLFHDCDPSDKLYPAADGSFVDFFNHSPWSGVTGSFPTLSSPTNSFSLFGYPPSIYQACIMTPRARAAQRIASSTARHDLMSDALMRHLGWFGSRTSKYILNLLKKADHKERLTIYIRQFESIVVQALKFYTVSIDVNVYKAVISLLVQLIQIRVNYCLLDNNQRFIAFLFQQLENMGDFSNSALSEELVSALFEFFIVLSYEKYQNRSVIDAPKIIQLFDAFSASLNDNNRDLGYSSLHRIVVDFYLLRHLSKVESAEDLEIQRECIVSILMKSIHSMKTLDLLTFILYRCKKDDSKWTKLSRDVVDALSPCLADCKLCITSAQDFNVVVSLIDFLSPAAFRPADRFLEILFDDSMREADVNRWLCVKFVCFYALFLHSKEDALLSRLEIISEEKPLIRRNSIGKHEKLPAHLGLLLATAIEVLLSATSEYDVLPSEVTIQFLDLLTHMCQSGSFPKTCQALPMVFMDDQNNPNIHLLSIRYPHIALQFLYMLSTLNVYCDRYWSPNVSPTMNSNRKLVQFVSQILYADHVKKNVAYKPQNFYQYLVLCEEPPICELYSHWLKEKSSREKLLITAENFILVEDNRLTAKMKLVKRMGLLSENNGLIFVKFFVKCLSSDCYAIVSLAYSSLLSIHEKFSEALSRKDDSMAVSSELDVYMGHEIQNSKLNLQKFPRLSRFCQHSTGSVCSTAPYIDITEILNTTASKFKKPKFIQVIKSLCQALSYRIAPKILVELISSLDEDEIIEVLSDWHINCHLLEACVVYSVEVPNCTVEKTCLTENATRKCASAVIISILKAIVSKVPKTTLVLFDYTSYSFDLIEDNVHLNLLEKYVRIDEYLFTLNFLVKNRVLINSLNEPDLIVVINYVDILLKNCLTNNDRLPHKQKMKMMETVTYVFLNKSVIECSSNNDDINNLLSQMVGLCFWIIKKEFKDIDRIKLQRLAIKEAAKPITVLWYYVSILVYWIQAKIFEDFLLKSKRKSERFVICRNLITAIARLPCFRSFTRVPLSVYKYGWEPEIRTHLSDRHYLFANVPVRFLQNIDVLQEFTFRIQWIGWTSKQDFEEIWMGLLGVLSATPVGQELKENSVQEITDRVCTSTLTVKCLTGLLLKSLLYPSPGEPIHSDYVFKSRQIQHANDTTICRETAKSLKKIIDNGLRRNLSLDGHPEIMESFSSNVERLYDSDRYGTGQFPTETLWSLTGILKEEEQLLSSQNDSTLKNPTDRKLHDQNLADDDRHCAVNVIDFIYSIQDDLNLQSCLHFILDLYGHWLADGPDGVPLPLLSATTDSVVLLSDLFTERKQYIWYKEKLTLIFQTRANTFDDELIMQHTVLGVLKSIAVLGNAENDSEKESYALIEAGLRQVQLSVRISTLRGVLYLLQALTSDEAVTLMPILSEYILSSLSVYALFDGVNVVLDKPQSLDHQLICWAIAFFIVESFHDPHTKQSFSPKFVEVCLKALMNKNAPLVIFEAVCIGMEALLAAPIIEPKFIKQLIDFSTNCIKNSKCSKTTLLVVRLLISCLYNVKVSQRPVNAKSPDSETPPNIMEPTVSAMEKLSLLMYKVSNGSVVEAGVLSNVLPVYLIDNFNPGDVMNRIIVELLQAPQYYPKLLMKILISVVAALLNREAKEVVFEWILLSISSFIQREPWPYARWCLTSLFLYSSSNDFVSKVWKLANNDGRHEIIEHRLFLLACEAFKSQLKDQTQVKSFEQVIDKMLSRIENTTATTS